MFLLWGKIRRHRLTLPLITTNILLKEIGKSAPPISSYINPEEKWIRTEKDKEIERKVISI